MCEQQLALAKKHLDDDEYVPQNIGVPWCMYKLAMAYSWADKSAEMEELLRSALQLYEDYCRCHADDSVPAQVREMRVIIQSELREQSADCGDLDALHQGLSSCQQRYGMESLHCADYWHSIAALHEQAGHLQPAVDAATEALRIKTALFGPQHRDLIDLYSWLGDVHRQWKQYQLALAAYERAVAISSQQDSHDQLLVADIHPSMASCYFALGRGRQAARCCSEALAVYELAMPNTRQVAIERWNLYTDLRMAGEEPARQAELLRGALAVRELLGNDASKLEAKRRLLRELEAAEQMHVESH